MVMGDILRVLDGLHHQIAISITGMTARHSVIGEWEWPPVAEALETAVLWPIKKYI